MIAGSVMYRLQCKKTKLQPVNLYFEQPTVDTLLNGEYGELYEKLCKCKNNLNFFHEKSLKDMYIVTRNELYPKNDFYSRAGTKIRDIFREIPELSNFKSFIDLCSGPGAWTDYLLELGGKGISLSIQTSNPNFCFYSTLEVNPNVECKYMDIREILSNSEEYTCVDLITADGAIDSENENLQEIVCAETILTECIYIKYLKLKGNFIVKIFDTFTSFSKTLIYTLSQMFTDIYIYKPDSSRGINSEKYLICLTLKNKDYIDLLTNVLINYKTIPKCVIPIISVHSDSKFSLGFGQYMKRSVEIQCNHLNKIIEKLEEKITPKEDECIDFSKGKYGKAKGKGFEKGKNYNFFEKGKGDKGKGKGYKKGKPY